MVQEVMTWVIVIGCSFIALAALAKYIYDCNVDTKEDDE